MASLADLEARVAALEADRADYRAVLSGRSGSASTDMARKSMHSPPASLASTSGSAMSRSRRMPTARPSTLSVRNLPPTRQIRASSSQRCETRLLTIDKRLAPASARLMTSSPTSRTSSSTGLVGAPVAFRQCPATPGAGATSPSAGLHLSRSPPARLRRTERAQPLVSALVRTDTAPG